MTVIAGLLYIGVTFIGVAGCTRSVSPRCRCSWCSVLGRGRLRLDDDLVRHHGLCRQQRRGDMSMGVGLTVVIALFIDAGTVTADFNRWAQGPGIAPDFDLQRFPVRQSLRHAGRRRDDRGAGGSQRQSVRRRQHVRLHERMQLGWLSVLAFVFLY